MIKIGLTEEELLDTFQAVEDGLFSAKEAFNNVMTFNEDNHKEED